MEIKPTQSRLLHFQAPHQRQKSLDCIKVCSLTWGRTTEPHWGSCSPVPPQLLMPHTIPWGSRLLLCPDAGSLCSFIAVGTLNISVPLMHVWWGHCCHWTHWGGPQLCILTQSPSKDWSPEYCRHNSVQNPLTCGPGFPLCCGPLGWFGMGAFSCSLWSIPPAYTSISPFLHRAFAHWISVCRRILTRPWGCKDIQDQSKKIFSWNSTSSLQHLLTWLHWTVKQYWPNHSSLQTLVPTKTLYSPL